LEPVKSQKSLDRIKKYYEIVFKKNINQKLFRDINAYHYMVVGEDFIMK
jgi:hypothetical protein